jgi:sterol desaturase/sphingolipid hydroxylase (fatty acid hydroxylase superfamily)
VHPASVQALDYVSEQQFGLLQWLDVPAATQHIIGFLLLDLTFYYWHRANHAVSFLWRFHNAHHIDPDLDVSTAFRFHFAEVAMSAMFRVVQVVAIGVSPVTYAVYELVFQANTLFHHSNVRLPLVLERTLNKILVTPRMHGVHHSEVRRENTSNFSSVFSWWDRLHATLRLNVPQSRIFIGIPAYTAAADNQLKGMLEMPFRRQRDYWRRADGTVPQRGETELHGGLHVMAE